MLETLENSWDAEIYFWSGFVELHLVDYADDGSIVVMNDKDTFQENDKHLGSEQ